MLSILRGSGAPLRGQIVAAIAAVALVGGVAASLGEAQSSLAAANSNSTTAVTVAQKTQRVFDDTNEVRAEAGTTPLVRNAALDKVASDWAYQQWKNGAMSHNPDYSTQIPAGWSHAGENVAAGYDCTQVTPAWKNSPEHYKNLVGDYTDIGIGVYQAPDGTIYWTQEFAKYSTTTVPPKQTPTNAPSSTPSSSPRATASSAPATSAPASSAAVPSGSSTAEPGAPAGTAIALNSPSFEGSSAGWSASGASLDGPNTNAKGGEYALAVTGGQTVSQAVNATVTAGETDTVTIWVKPGSTASVTGQLTLTAVGGTTETATTSFRVSSGWMRVSVALPVAQAGHTGFRIDVVLANSGRAYRLDSASLVRTRTAVAAAAPVTSSAPPAAPSATTPSAPAAATASSTPAPAASSTPAPTPTPTSTPTSTPTPAPNSSSSGGLNLGVISIGLGG